MLVPLQEMDEWLMDEKFQNLSNASSKHIQSVRSVREEIAGYRRDVSVIFLLLFLAGTTTAVCVSCVCLEPQQGT